MSPDLGAWLPEPALAVAHRREAAVDHDALWYAARNVRLADTAMLGHLIRWRIPAVTADVSYYELFRAAPFTVLYEDERTLLSGLVGRIWTLRRDYPALAAPEEFRRWDRPGTARVLFANWVEAARGDRAALLSETRVWVRGREARLGLAAVRPLISTFNSLIGSEALSIAVQRAEARRESAK
ncbi:MAG: hypothetical protein ACLP0J_02070 [Solirubrobacteraceae bacterium]